MSLKLTFEIKLMSDYHVGAGHGKGAGVDSALLRDADGVPVIRGTTLTGLLRDGLWRLLQLPPLREKYHPCQGNSTESGGTAERYCGQHSTDTRSELCPICRLFGTPRTPKYWRMTSARPKDLAQASSQVMEHGGHTVQRVRVSPRTRRAEPRKLFSQEDGAGGLVFRFTVAWPTGGAGALDEAALLVATARNVRQLGRSRRRGQGECLFTLTDVEGAEIPPPAGEKNWQNWLLDRFAARWLNAEPAPHTAPAATRAGLSSSTDGAPVRVRLIVRTDEPLLIARRAEAGNQFESLLSITGQTIRGLLAWRAACRYNLEGETYRAFVNMFLHNQVLFPNLFPARFEASTLYQAIPVPLDVLTCKVGGLSHGVWFATQEDATHQERQKCASCPGPLTEVRDFVTLLEYHWSPDALFEHKPKRSSEMHIRLDPESGRVAEGDLFGYVALDVGQYFMGDLVCANTQVWEQLQALADIQPSQSTPLRIGKAHRRGYGGVTAWFEVISSNEDTWRCLPLEQRVKEGTVVLHLTLLTDAIIADAWGRYAVGFEASWLSDVLKRPVQVVKVADGSRMVDGFDANLGLPRWRDVALAAGSTALLKLTAPPDLDHLRALEQQGMGLRRNEGFGQITFNHPVYEYCQGITDGITVPEKLLLAATRTDEEKSFCREWLKALDKRPWDKCSDVRFGAVARWLHTNRRTSPSELEEQLGSLGQPSGEVIELIGGREEYGQRYTLKPVGDRLSEQAGIKIIAEMLSQLDQQHQENFWPLGIEMLAERVAAVAQEKGAGA